MKRLTYDELWHTFEGNENKNGARDENRRGAKRKHGMELPLLPPRRPRSLYLGYRVRNFVS